MQSYILIKKSKNGSLTTEVIPHIITITREFASPLKKTLILAPNKKWLTGYYQSYKS